MKLSCMKEHSLLMKISLGKAMGEYFSDLKTTGDDYLQWYAAFEALIRCRNDQEVQEQFVIWEPYEDMSVEELISGVYSTADDFYSGITEILETVKAGMLVQSSATLCEALQTMDMQAIYEAGYLARTVQNTSAESE